MDLVELLPSHIKSVVKPISKTLSHINLTDGLKNKTLVYSYLETFETVSILDGLRFKIAEFFDSNFDVFEDDFFSLIENLIKNLAYFSGDISDTVRSGNLNEINIFMELFSHLAEAYSTTIIKEISSVDNNSITKFFLFLSVKLSIYKNYSKGMLFSISSKMLTLILLNRH